MDRAEFVALYQLAHAEYRAEVELGWRRAQLFLALGMAGPVVVGLRSPLEGAGVMTCLASAAACVAGVLIVRRSHGRYRATREPLQQLERELGVAGIGTTGGMREGHGQARAEGYRVTTVLAVLLGGLGVLNAALVMTAALGTR